jgi:malate dehydrogenase (oxaloacetate-decarboxylating)
MGWRHPRITDDEYYQFVDDFIQAVKQRWPDVLLQFEDFAQKNAMPLLNRYRDEICSFNDDIQGTAAVTVGTLIAASRAAGSQLSYQKSSSSVQALRVAVLPSRLLPRRSAKA